MKRRHISVLSGVAVAAVALSMAPAQAQAIPVQGDPEPKAANRDHDLPNPLGDAQRALRKEAVDKLVKGEATTETRGGQRVIKLEGKTKKGKKGKDRFVSYPVNREESIFTILSEFGDMAHNEIPEPDRNWDGSPTDDNSTYWLDDFNQAHYKDMMFGQGESLKDFYLKQSNGRFLAKGDVSDWVQVKGEAATYGDNDNEAAGYWAYITDTVNAWYEAQLAGGKTKDEVNAYLKQFDQVDRYDADGDGNFAEPDGYIDHFQAIHAGEGEEAGGGKLGADAIWSHRWYVKSTDIGKTGPGENKLGGAQIGEADIWVGDYTTEPENGGLGVFTHEFGHDLGLPDLYDTAGGDNGTGFWTLMSGGSWLNHGKDSIGTTPGYMGPWEKLQLGWLDYQVVELRQRPQGRRSARLTATTSGQPQAVVVNLPDKTVKHRLQHPALGLLRVVGRLGRQPAEHPDPHRRPDGPDHGVAVRVARVRRSRRTTTTSTSRPPENGTDWTALDTIDRREPLGQEDAGTSAPTPASRSRSGSATPPTAACTSRAPFLDDLTITADGTTVLDDDVESGDNGWTADGFTRMGGSTEPPGEPLLPGREPRLQGLRRHAEDGPVQLRPRQHQARLGGALPLPERPARLVLRRCVHRQQHQRRTPVAASCPAGRRAPGARHLPRRGQARQPPPAVRRHLRPRAHGQGDVPPQRRSRRRCRRGRASRPSTTPTRTSYWTADNPWSSTKTAGSGVKHHRRQAAGRQHVPARDLVTKLSA